MKRGKKICQTLKDIRLQVARANDIPYEPTECKHKGDLLRHMPEMRGGGALYRVPTQRPSHDGKGCDSGRSECRTDRTHRMQHFYTQHLTPRYKGKNASGHHSHS